MNCSCAFEPWLKMVLQSADGLMVFGVCFLLLMAHRWWNVKEFRGDGRKDSQWAKRGLLGNLHSVVCMVLAVAITGAVIFERITR